MHSFQKKYCNIHLLFKVIPYIYFDFNFYEGLIFNNDFLLKRLNVNIHTATNFFFKN